MQVEARKSMTRSLRTSQAGQGWEGTFPAQLALDAAQILTLLSVA